MSEEQQELNLEPTENQEQPPETDPVEDAAREQGWKPKEEYEGDPAKWVSAETFVARAPLFDKIDELSRKVKTLDQGNAALKQHYEKLRATEYDRALEALRAEHRAKLEDGDLLGADEVKDKINDVRAEAKEAERQAKVPQDSGPNPEFVSWVERNKWYATDEELRDAADVYGVRYHKQGMSPKEVLLKVSEQIKKTFPDKFRNPNKDTASAVESKVTNGRGTRAPSIEDSMTADEKRVMHRIVNSGVMTKAEYLKDYEAIQGVK